MRRLLLATAAACALALGAPQASANGRFPASNQIVFSPSQPGTILVRTTFGIILSSDSGATWRWLCEDVLGLPSTSNEDPYLGITGNGSLVAGLSLGMQVSPTGGCGWNVAGGPLTGQLVKDLVVRRDNAHAVDAVTSTYGASAGADGGEGYTQRLFETTDDGVTWAGFGAPIDPAAIVTTIEVAPSDPSRIYVSAFRGQGMTRTASLFVSRDHGASWVERPAPLDPAHETALYIGAVDPTNADRVYLRSAGLSRLSVTSDAGQSFQSVQTLPDQMLGLALSADGSKVYVGSVAAGLLVADTKTFTFAQTSTIQVQCLATRGTELWACSSEVSGFVAGVSQDDGKTFTPRLHLLDIEGPIVCPAGALGTQCTQWQDGGGAFYNPFVGLCIGLGGCDDGGPPTALGGACSCTGACAASFDSNASEYHPSASCRDAGATADAGTEVHPDRKSSCGCSVVGGTGTAGAAGASALAALALRARRRRRGR